MVPNGATFLKIHATNFRFMPHSVHALWHVPVHATNSIWTVPSMDTRLQALQHLKNLVNETIVEDDEISFFINYILMEEFAYEDDKSIHGGSVPGRRYIRRDREAHAIKLYKDYFSHDPRYNDRLFRRRFRMRRHLFLRVVDGLQKNGKTFVQKRDCTGRNGFNPIQKATVAMRLLAYNMAADSLDEGMEIGESTATNFFKQFCIEIVQVFAPDYLRKPIEEELEGILKENAGRGWPGLIGSLDCMHWKWLMCPLGWQGSYKGKESGPTLVLEAVCDKKLWVYHYNFGRPGSNNDLNILAKSTLLDDIIAGRIPSIRFKVGVFACYYTNVRDGGAYFNSRSMGLSMIFPIS